MKRPSVIGIIGLVLALIGLYLFLDLNLDVFSYMAMPDPMRMIQILPIVGGVLLGIGMAVVIKEKNPILTVASFILFSALAFKNIAAIGFGIGMLVPGLIGIGKHLPTYLAALMVFLSAFITVSADPSMYQDLLVSSLADQVTSSLSGMQDAIASAVENQVNSMLPSRDEIASMVESAMPCNDTATQEMCVSAREQIIDQVYNEIKSQNYSQIIKEKIGEGLSIDKETAKKTIKEIEFVKPLLDNIQWIIAFLETGIFLFVASIVVNIPQGVTGFLLDIIWKIKPRKEEGSEEEAVEE